MSRRSHISLLFFIALFACCNKQSSSSTGGSPQASTTAPAAAASADAPPGYSVVASTDTGKSLATQKTNTASVQAALMSTFPDLEKYFGNRPTIGSAYQNAKDPTTGGATFGAIYKGQPVRGIVSCKVHDNAAAVSVVYGRNDAPKADWEKLMSPPPSAPEPANPQAAATPAAPVIPLKEYDFPDGTGSVGVADGWTAKGQSVCDPTLIFGPAGQMLILHSGMNISTPDSTAVKMRQKLLDMQAKNAEGAARFHIKQQPPKPLPPLMVAPLTDPATAVQNMIPNFSAMSQFNGGPTQTLDKIISSKDMPCANPNGKCALINYSVTFALKNGQTLPLRAEALLVVAPIPGFNDTWSWMSQYVAQAPAATFDKDYPAMIAMVQSQKVNNDRAMQVVQDRTKAMQQAGQAMVEASRAQQRASFEQFQKDQQTRQDNHNQQMAANQAGYDAHNQQFRDNQLQRSRSAADFNESIIGTRTIYDTVTGQSGYAKLTDVNGVVDSLNQAALDPNRFVQIPLRDQLYPLPAGK